METVFKIKKGLDFKLKGEAEATLEVMPLAQNYAIKPTDFEGITPKAMVKPGVKVLAGDALFIDKATGKISFVSPVSGTVTEVERGERRKLLRFVVEPDKEQKFRQFDTQTAMSQGGAKMVELLCQSGLFAFMRQRPYDVVPQAEVMPKSIFVSAFSKMPLAADFSFVVKGQEADFKTGIEALSKVAPVHVGISPEQINTDLLPLQHAKVNVFEGPNPAGNVGVHINHVDPVNKGEVVWTMGAEAVVFVGRLMRTGHVDLTRRVAVAGSRLSNPHYLQVLVGMPVNDMLRVCDMEETGHVRIINGNPFTGYPCGVSDHLGAYTTELCILPEGDDVHEAFGWIAPRMNDFSTSRSYFSWLQGKNHAYDLDCRIKGGERHMIMSAEYERVFPMDIYPEFLVKAIITGDIDRQEALGIYEVAPEDFAVAEFIDSSKLELQRIVRQGLDILRKENA